MQERSLAHNGCNMKSAVLNELNYKFKTNINMKTKSSILALTKAFFILLVMCCFFSCTRGDELKNTNKFDKYDVIVIDSCEYIRWGVSYGYMNITHKGNCKYCAERTKRSLK